MTDTEVLVSTLLFFGICIMFWTIALYDPDNNNG